MPLALAFVPEGSSRAEAARAAGMVRQTLRDWVHHYNAEEDWIVSPVMVQELW